jgi:hypothetical protein
VVERRDEFDISFPHWYMWCLTLDEPRVYFERKGGIKPPSLDWNI